MLRILLFSDTHSQHSKIDTNLFKDVDVSIFAGDICGYTDPWKVNRDDGREEIKNFSEWYSKVPCKKKLLIFGNHDFYGETMDDITKKEMLEDKEIILLNDSGCEIEGVKFWGTPITPFFFNWAFNRMPGKEIEKHWEVIPSSDSLDAVDVLISHGPVHGILDLCNKNGKRVGCPSLRKAVFERIKPKVHVAGHIHEGYGYHEEQGIKFYNCSVLDENYYMRNMPVIIKV